MRRAIDITDRRGFSFVETVVAAFILALGLFAIGVATYTQFSFINLNRERAIATLAAQEEIENIRGMDFDDLDGLSSTFTASGFAYLDNPVGSLSVQSSYGDDMRKVSVRVSWGSLTGRAMTRDLATLVTRNGINKQ